jgi:hypothetical protein
MRKAITSALREGHSIINLDNIEGPLASPELAKAITQSEYQDRLLGESRMLRLPTNVLWTATGNNLAFRGDLSSRALLCRIDSGMERPEERTFTIPDLKDFLIMNRKQIVAAALTILRAYHVAGRPHQDVQPWGGFEDWSRAIREALVWAGLPDPCKTRETVLADDPEREESLALLHALREAFGDSKFTVKEAVDRCEEDGALRSAILAIAAARDARNQVDPKRLGWWCRRSRDRTIGGLQLRRCGKALSKVAHWQIEIRDADACGHKGHEGQFRATKSTPEPESNARPAGDGAGWAENDPENPSNRLDGSDEVIL